MTIDPRNHALHLAFASGTAEPGAALRDASDTGAELIVAVDGDLAVSGPGSVTRLAAPGATFVHGAGTTVTMPTGGRCMVWRLSPHGIAPRGNSIRSRRSTRTRSSGQPVGTDSETSPAIPCGDSRQTMQRPLVGASSAPTWRAVQRLR